MKKTLALILLTSMLLCSCSMHIGKNTTIFEGILIRHSENFTEEDFEFVYSLHSVDYKNSMPFDMPMPFTLGEIIDNIRAGDQSTLFLMELDVNKSYYICKYGKSIGERPDLPDKCNVSDFIWVKYDNSEDILPEYNGVKLQKSYILFDGVVKNDIVNEISYNKPCKYYLEFFNDKRYFSDTNKLMIYRDRNLTDTSKMIFVTQSSFSEDYKIYTDNGTNYLLFVHQTYSETEQGYINRSEQCFGEYYDVLAPEFVRFEEFDEGLVEGQNMYINEIYGVNIAKLIDLIH